MKCYRHRHRDCEAVGVCAACGKGLCAYACAHDGAAGVHCDDACAQRSRRREPRGDASVAWVWSITQIVFGVALLYYGYRYSAWTLNVPNMLGMMLLWYGVFLLLQRVANRTSKSASISAPKPSSTTTSEP